LTAKIWNVGDVLTASDVNVYLVALSGVKSADQTITAQTSFVNDADVRFPVAANSIYEFHVYLRYASSTGGDWKTSFTVPAGAVAKFSKFGNNLSGGPDDITIERSDTDLVTSQGKGPATIMLTEFFGYVDTASTAGNLILQWAQNTASGTATLKQNSYLTGRRIA
jgi:hypothetical protein